MLSPRFDVIHRRSIGIGARRARLGAHAFADFPDLVGPNAK
jgi:hypothetical protein